MLLARGFVCLELIDIAGNRSFSLLLFQSCLFMTLLLLFHGDHIHFHLLKTGEAKNFLLFLEVIFFTITLFQFWGKISILYTTPLIFINQYTFLVIHHSIWRYIQGQYFLIVAKVNWWLVATFIILKCLLNPPQDCNLMIWMAYTEFPEGMPNPGLPIQMPRKITQVKQMQE